MKKLMIAAAGRDQAGIVAAFTTTLFQNQCNIEDTSMTILEDHFTMLLFVHRPETLPLDTLRATLEKSIAAFELHVSFFETDSQAETMRTHGAPWLFSISSPDQTGIMMRVTEILARHQINIRHLSSKRFTRPNESPLFLMSIEGDVPLLVSNDALQQEMQGLAEANAIEIHAEPLETYTL